MFNFFKKNRPLLYPWFNPEWNKLGIIFIPSECGRVSYFVKRSWGNYLFFPHPQTDQFFESAKARGGIYKVFDNQINFPQMNERIFCKFGAQTVTCSSLKRAEFPIEKFGEEYFDMYLVAQEDQWEMTIQKEIFIFSELTLSPHLANKTLARQYLNET